MDRNFRAKMIVQVQDIMSSLFSFQQAEDSELLIGNFHKPDNEYQYDDVSLDITVLQNQLLSVLNTANFSKLTLSHVFFIVISKYI